MSNAKNPLLIIGIHYILCLADILYDLSCNDKSGDRRDKCCASGDITALCAFVLCAGRTDTVCTAGYGHILDRPSRLFLGIYYFEFFYPALAALYTHYLCKWTHFCIVYISNAKRRRVKLIACPHTADNRDMKLLCLHDESELRCNGINCINNIIILYEWELIFVFGKEEALVYTDIRIGIYLFHSFSHDICLVLSHCFSCGDYLAVEICKTDLVIVNKVEFIYTASHKSFADISAHTADTEYCHPCICKLIHSLTS